jgi:hypothetical protein
MDINLISDIMINDFKESYYYTPKLQKEIKNKNVVTADSINKCFDNDIYSLVINLKIIGKTKRMAGFKIYKDDYPNLFKEFQFLWDNDKNGYYSLIESIMKQIDKTLLEVR